MICSNKKMPNAVHVSFMFVHLRVFLCIATDRDSIAQGGDQGIRYMLKETNLTGLLIDAVTGEAILTKPVPPNLERDRTTGLRAKQHYEAIVRAIDSGDPPLESEARLIFPVKSERDGEPVFIGEPYNASIAENAAPGSLVFKLTGKSCSTIHIALGIAFSLGYRAASRFCTAVFH